MGRPRILLADDHRSMLEGVCSLLQPHFEVIRMEGPWSAKHKGLNQM